MSDINWFSDLKAAKDTAANSKEPLLIDIWSDG
jgi:hypothetical protein